MSRIATLLALLGLVALTSHAYASCTEAEYQKVLKKMVKKAKKTTGLTAAWLRAGFHDCITVNAATPGSGCNGSLRDEIGDFRNTRLDLAVNALEEFVNPTGKLPKCFGWADGFMAATEAALLAGKITIPSNLKLVDLNNPRTDSPDGFTDGQLASSPPQTVQPEFLQLPGPLDSFDTLVTFYAARGMDVKDLVSSSVIGHAIGKFVEPLAPGTAPIDFTGKQKKITSRYAKNLNRRRKKIEKTGEDPGNRAGFNTMDSDDTLITTSDGQDLIEAYAGGPVGFSQCVADFFVFLGKMKDL